jgi:hypothetical protein
VQAGVFISGLPRCQRLSQRLESVRPRQKWQFRVCSFNPTRLTCRNELDGDGRRHDVAFVPDEVYVVTTGIRARQTSENPEAPGVSSPHIKSVNVLAGLWLWHIYPAVRL